MTKTLPNDAPIVTRTTAEDAVPARPEESREILDAIDAAMEEHADWLCKWHRSVVCGLPPAREVISKHAQYLGRFGNWFDINSQRDLLNQPVFRELWAAYLDVHELGRNLAMGAVDGTPLQAKDYDSLMEKVDRFGVIARRIRDAFQRAVFDLDPLTGVHNRRSMMTELNRERERALRTNSPLCVGLCDIDHFKAVNDEHGHAVGDTVLLAVAGRLIANLRAYDSIYRYGGEEFLLALPNADEATAGKIAERLRQAVAKPPVPAGEALSVPVTASFGVCLTDPGATLEQTIDRADKALYQAKRGGRNRVVLWTGRAGDAADDA